MRPARRPDPECQRVPEPHAVELGRKKVAGADRQRQPEKKTDRDAADGRAGGVVLSGSHTLFPGSRRLRGLLSVQDGRMLGRWREGRSARGGLLRRLGHQEHSRPVQGRARHLGLVGLWAILVGVRAGRPRSSRRFRHRIRLLWRVMLGDGIIGVTCRTTMAARSRSLLPSVSAGSLPKELLVSWQENWVGAGGVGLQRRIEATSIRVGAERALGIRSSQGWLRGRSRVSMANATICTPG